MSKDIWPHPDCAPLLQSIKHKLPYPVDCMIEWTQIVQKLEHSHLQDIKGALEIAAKSKHPDAVWLTKIFAGRRHRKRSQARDVFLEHPNDGRALYFSVAVMSIPTFWYDRDVSDVLRSATLGFLVAQAKIASLTMHQIRNLDISEEQIKKFRENAASQYIAGGLWRYGLEIKNSEEANMCMMLAGELGFADASAIIASRLHDLGDPNAWIWWGRAARTDAESFPVEFPRKVELFFSKRSKAGARHVFAIGFALEGQVDDVNRKIANLEEWDEDEEVGLDEFKFDECLVPALLAIEFKVLQVKAARRAVDAWTGVGMRLKICKDVRKLIGKLIWDARSEASYDTKLAALQKVAARGRKSSRQAVDKVVGFAGKLQTSSDLAVMTDALKTALKECERARESVRKLEQEMEKNTKKRPRDAE